MIQDIFPLKFNNTYREKNPSENSVILHFLNQKILLKKSSEILCYPKLKEISGPVSLVYLFTIAEKDFFLVENNQINIPMGFGYEDIQVFRSKGPKHLAFAGITACQLYNWYQNNKFCGKCGHITHKSKIERMLQCPECGNMIYPKISPAVIVAVTDGNRLLMTKYAGRAFKRYALIAGFTEIGETLEETVEREVMEEVGLRVKNIRYYKCQPWSFSDTLLVGFYAEVDGDHTVKLDQNELSEGKWFEREQIPGKPEDMSLTNEMIMEFKFGRQ